MDTFEEKAKELSFTGVDIERHVKDFLSNNWERLELHQMQAMDQFFFEEGIKIVFDVINAMKDRYKNILLTDDPELREYKVEDMFPKEINIADYMDSNKEYSKEELIDIYKSIHYDILTKKI